MSKKCPYCGVELEKISSDEWLCPECGESFYSDNPKSLLNSAIILVTILMMTMTKRRMNGRNY